VQSGAQVLGDRSYDLGWSWVIGVILANRPAIIFGSAGSAP
jgi:hypothetical protein